MKLMTGANKWRCIERRFFQLMVGWRKAFQTAMLQPHCGYHRHVQRLEQALQ